MKNWLFSFYSFYLKYLLMSQYDNCQEKLGLTIKIKSWKILYFIHFYLGKSQDKINTICTEI